MMSYDGYDEGDEEPQIKVIYDDEPETTYSSIIRDGKATGMYCFQSAA